MGKRLYDSLYERIVANTAEPENGQACWLWLGQVAKDNGYPRITVRVPEKPHPVKIAVHRAMLEIIHEVEFPFDEAGHLCYTRACCNPDHLEIQTASFNSSERRGYNNANGCCIPTLFPVEDELQIAADRAWDEPGIVSSVCPF